MSALLPSYVLCEVRVLQEYTAQAEGELHLYTNQLIWIIEKSETYWWFGQCEDSTEGYLPVDYVEVVRENDGSSPSVDQAALEETRRQKAATLIQAVWRGWVAYKHYQEIKKRANLDKMKAPTSRSLSHATKGRPMMKRRPGGGRARRPPTRRAKPKIAIKTSTEDSNQASSSSSSQASSSKDGAQIRKTFGGPAVLSFNPGAVKLKKSTPTPRQPATAKSEPASPFAGIQLKKTSGPRKSIVPQGKIVDAPLLKKAPAISAASRGRPRGPPQPSNPTFARNTPPIVGRGGRAQQTSGKPPLLSPRNARGRGGGARGGGARGGGARGGGTRGGGARGGGGSMVSPRQGRGGRGGNFRHTMVVGGGGPPPPLPRKSIGPPPIQRRGSRPMVNPAAAAMHQSGRTKPQRPHPAALAVREGIANSSQPPPRSPRNVSSRPIHPMANAMQSSGRSKQAHPMAAAFKREGSGRVQTMVMPSSIAPSVQRRKPPSLLARDHSLPQGVTNADASANVPTKNAPPPMRVRPQPSAHGYHWSQKKENVGSFLDGFLGKRPDQEVLQKAATGPPPVPPTKPVQTKPPPPKLPPTAAASSSMTSSEPYGGGSNVGGVLNSSEPTSTVPLALRTSRQQKKKNRMTISLRAKSPNRGEQFKSNPFCCGCKKSFGFSRTKHHCRNCLQSFCSKCSKNNLVLPDKGYATPTRVCDTCFYLINSKRHEQAFKTV